MLVYPGSAFEKLGYYAVKESVSTYLRSEMGFEELEAMKPVSGIKTIQAELKRLNEMMRLQQEESHIPFAHPWDVRDAAKKSRVKRAILDPESLHKTGLFCSTCRILKKFIMSKSANCPALAELAQYLVPLKELEDEISRVISEHGAVKDNASSELRQIRKSIASRKNDLRSTMDRIIRSMNKDGYLAEFEATIRNGRMVLPVRAEHKRKISGFVQDVSATGQTVYLEPAEALHINNDIRELEQQERREVERILMELTAKVGDQYSFLISNAANIGQFDLLIAKSSFCTRLNAIVPALKEQSVIHLRNARNPVLILKQRKLPKDERETIIPLNLTLEQEEKGIIISGPNAGGKSVSLKTVALLQMMVQSGLAITADEDTILPVFGSLFLDMGDDQSIDNDLSTFSSRLTWMRETLAKADENSLILIDEAGTGTDPEEGVALYQAFLEELYEKNCTMIVTTHHGNLKVFGHNHPAFANASMAFDQTRLTPTYQFVKGVPGSSYAFEISKRLGLDDKLLERARNLIGSSKNRLESLILDMEGQKQDASRLKSEVFQEKVKLEKLMNSYEQRLKTLTTERDKLREKALNEAKTIMDSANARIEEAIRKIVESKGDKKKIREIRSEIEQAKEQTEQDLKETATKRKSKNLSKKTDPPVVGDTVALDDARSAGELLEINGKQAVVLVNGLRIKTNYNRLVKTNKEPQKKEPTFKMEHFTEADSTPRIKPNLDLRGLRGEEAVNELTYYIDRAVQTRLSKVEIIHGKGDGVLKKRVHEILSGRKDVRSFELAPWEQGGPGCTIAELQ
ncbi:MAG: endonuclease MutS2 [Balneolales bacterium]|nr:endonuclease MutS2 [Balneolales bacterium]